EGGARLRLVHPWSPRLYYAGAPAALRQAAALLGGAAPRRGVRESVTVRPTKRQDLLQGEIEVVEVTVADPLAFPRLVARLARIDGLTFYNCDIALPQMYLYERRLFPLGRCAVEATPEGTIRDIAPLESPWEAEYTVPPLMTLRLRLDGDPANPNHGHRAVLHVGVDGEEGGLVGETPADLLEALDRWLRRYDPDIILTEWGDSFLMPRLARLGRMPVQHTARTSVGTTITSMQLDQAYQEGILIPWRKSRPEAFKSGSDLLLTDRGGLTYTPLIGAYERVGELDFAAMYPAMMSRYNISQETVNCACCRDDPAARVPGIPHHLCRKRQGLIPRVLGRVLDRRAYYKRRRAETSGAEHHLYDMRQAALKWIGVVCLDGGTLVPHRQGGRWRIAPIREIVEAHLPGESTGVKPVEDLAVAGIDPALRTCL